MFEMLSEVPKDKNPVRRANQQKIIKIKIWKFKIFLLFVLVL